MLAARPAVGLLILAASVVTCARPRAAAGPASAAPRAGTAAIASTSATEPPGGPPPFALQIVPPNAEPRWGGRGDAVALVQPGCDVAIVDLVDGVVSRRVPACSVWPSPTDDVFLVRTREGAIHAWDAGGGSRGLVSFGDPGSEAPVWSPDGSRVALLFARGITVLDPDGWRVARHIDFDGASGRLRWSGPDGGWRADGQELVVTDDARAWVAGLGAAPFAVPTSCAQVHEARFAPRGDALAVACAGAEPAEIWDSRARRLTATVPRFVAWDPTGRRVVGGEGTHLDVHDAVTGARLLRVDTATRDTHAFSPDGERIVVEENLDGVDRALGVWHIGSAVRLARLPAMTAPQWSADGAYLTVGAGASDGRFRQLVLEKQGWREVRSRPGWPRMAWSPRGARLAVASGGPALVIEDPAGEPMLTVPGASSPAFTGLARGAGGELVASIQDGTECHAARIDAQGGWSVVDAPCASPFQDESPDGAKRARVVRRSAVMMDMGWQLFVDDTASGQHAFVDYGRSHGPSLVWSARGHRLLVVHGDALLYEADGRRPWAVHVKGDVRGAALDAGGERAAFSMADGSLVVARLESHEEPRVLSGAESHEEPATRLAFEGDRLAAISDRGSVAVWDVARRARVATWSAGFAPERVAWAAGGGVLVMTQGDTLRLSRPDGSGAVTLTALSTAGATTLLATDEAGFVDGPPEALALVRWRVTNAAGDARWLYADGVERETHRSPVRAAMVALLCAGGTWQPTVARSGP